MALGKLVDNVARKGVEHAAPLCIENGIDVSTKNRTWRSYFCDTRDKTPEARYNFKGLKGEANSRT